MTKALPTVSPRHPTPTNPSQSNDQSAAATTAGVAGRGGIAVAAAKMYFLVIGLLQQVLLTRVLGTANYGALSTALSISAVAYNPIVTTSIQGVSRTVARADDVERPFATRRVLRYHAALALPLAIAFAGLARPIVRLIHAPHLILPVQILAAVLFFYGLYAPLVGVLNGQRRFVWQAGFDIGFATLRTALMVGGAYLLSRPSGLGVVGASTGFAIAAASIFIAAVALIGTGKRGDVPGLTLRAYLSFIGPVFAGQILLNLLQQADLTVLRYFAASSALAERLSPEAADPLVGAYRATQLFCFLPYQLLISVTFVLFPLLSKAHRDENTADVKLFVMTGVRVAFIVAGTMVSVISGLSGPLLRLVFPSDVALQGTAAMQLLALGFGAFAIFGILTTVLTSLKAERTSALITGLAFVLVVMMGGLLLHGQSFGAHLLLRTAIATSLGLVAATSVAAWFVKRLAGAIVPLATMTRVLIATAFTITIGRYWAPQGKLTTMLACGLLVATYFGLMVLMRELTKRDLGHVRALFGARQVRNSG